MTPEALNRSLQKNICTRKLHGMPRLKAPQRREQLIEVATKLFARNGYEATTTAAIALAAGVTEAWRFSK